MPRLIDPGQGDAITLDQLVEELDTSPFDVRDEDSFAALGPLLARLGRNRDFLADLAIAELKTRCAGQVGLGGYGAQAFLLRPPNGRYLLRANFWPARSDAITRESGTAAFFYDVPHDHNFAFLTYGYFGPGYWSDYYEYDPARMSGLGGEPAGLRFVERARLSPGKLMLYRRSRDVHVQLPPDAFSVSLNILGADPAQPWIDQYRFDIARDTVRDCLTCTGSEVLLGLAAHFGNGQDLAHDFARRHPSRRMRATAWGALVSAAPGTDAAAALLEAAADAPDPQIAGRARQRLARLRAGNDSSEAETVAADMAEERANLLP
ncbi:transposase [Stakelama tenebrarum]|uniref:Transposase n=1 Tax=Stakelama tenebrarum TaxID=2711215 RepID=A0A6G6Y1V5_9SPHN|nr:transposase [Sphingosinithalassobacter tenebrarum]QIG78924.1 transposase [Sphingosinithalassobacter tenebrarum]